MATIKNAAAGTCKAPHRTVLHKARYAGGHSRRLLTVLVANEEVPSSFAVFCSRWNRSTAFRLVVKHAIPNHMASVQARRRDDQPFGATAGRRRYRLDRRKGQRAPDRAGGGCGGTTPRATSARVSQGIVTLQQEVRWQRRRPSRRRSAAAASWSSASHSPPRSSLAERGARISPHRPKESPGAPAARQAASSTATTSKRPCWMREVLCDRRLVDKPATGPEDPSNLTQRRACARDPAADVIARAEIDDQIERAVVEGSSRTSPRARSRPTRPSAFGGVRSRPARVVSPRDSPARRRRVPSAIPPRPTSSPVNRRGSKKRENAGDLDAQSEGESETSMLRGSYSETPARRLDLGPGLQGIQMAWADPTG